MDITRFINPNPRIELIKLSIWTLQSNTIYKDIVSLDKEYTTFKSDSTRGTLIGRNLNQSADFIISQGTKLKNHIYAIKNAIVELKKNETNVIIYEKCYFNLGRGFEGYQ